jgi:hypothetical protein
MKFLIFSTSFFLFFIGCKPTEPAKPKQWLNCYVRYLTQENKIRAEATLKQGLDEKTAQLLEIKNGLKFNNATMSLISKQGLTYKYERDGMMEASRVFEFTTDDDKVIKFDLPATEVKDFSFPQNIVVLKQANTLTWMGEPLYKDEKFVLIWENPEHGTVSMEVSGTGGKNTIEFPAAELAKLQAGKWMLYLVRTKTTRTTVNDVSVRGIGECYSKTKEIVVK